MVHRYWNHNVAYHKWILRQIRPDDVVCDVGCGDGLLMQRLAACCQRVVGLEPHAESARTACARLSSVENACVLPLSFEAYEARRETYDVIIFTASLHHMELSSALETAKALLRRNGRILVVGLARPKGLWDGCLEVLRVIPAWIGSRLHGEKRGGDVGVPIRSAALSLAEIRREADALLPGGRYRRGLYYRYLLSWCKH